MLKFGNLILPQWSILRVSHKDTETPKKFKMTNLEEINTLTQKIIGCAIEVHRRLGSGLLESIYEKAICIKLEYNSLKFERQKTIRSLSLCG